MKKDKIVVFDILGPLYHYDAKGWINGAADPAIEILRKAGYKFSNDEEAARVEEDYFVNKGNKPIIMPGFAEIALYLNSEGIKPVVVSAGTDKVLGHMVECAAKDYSDRIGEVIDPKQLVRAEDLTSTIPIGSKKDPKTWIKAVDKYRKPETLAVFEDSFANLMAAVDGLDAEVGYHVTSTKSGLSVLLSDQRIFRGHMEEAYGHIKQR